MYKKTIVEIHYDHIPPISDAREVWPEEFMIREVGKKYKIETGEKLTVIAIRERPSRWKEDKGYFVIEFEDGTEIRTYRPDKVIYK